MNDLDLMLEPIDTAYDHVIHNILNKNKMDLKVVVSARRQEFLDRLKFRLINGTYTYESSPNHKIAMALGLTWQKRSVDKDGRVTVWIHV